MASRAESQVPREPRRPQDAQHGPPADLLPVIGGSFTAEQPAPARPRSRDAHDRATQGLTGSAALLQDQSFSEAVSAASVNKGEGAGGERQESRSERSGEGGKDAGAGFYDAQAAAREDHVAIVARLNTITGLLQELREGMAQQVVLQEQQWLATEQLLAAVQQERHLVDELLANGIDQGPGVAFAAQQQATVIDTETADASKRWPSSAWDKIKAEVKKVLTRLWGMISKLVTVKEWTLTGKVGTPGPLLGLAEASVSVTFGR